MLRFITLSQASSGWSSAGAPQVAPALLTRMSTWPSALHRLVGDARGSRSGWLAVGGDPARVDAAWPADAAAASSRSAGLARGQQDARAGFAERLGDLQAEAARAAGDERGLAGEVEQLLDRCAHGCLGVEWNRGAIIDRRRGRAARAAPDQHDADRRGARCRRSATQPAVVAVVAQRQAEADDRAGRRRSASQTSAVDAVLAASCFRTSPRPSCGRCRRGARPTPSQAPILGSS